MPDRRKFDDYTKRIAGEAGRAAAQETFYLLGIDMTDKKEILTRRDDFAFLRDAKKTVRLARNTGVGALVLSALHWIGSSMGFIK